MNTNQELNYTFQSTHCPRAKPSIHHDVYHVRGTCSERSGTCYTINVSQFLPHKNGISDQRPRTVSTRAPQPALTVDVRCGWSIDPVDLGEFADPKVELTLASNTPAVCVSECTTRGYSLAAVEYGDQCSCGNAYIDDIPPTSAGSWNCKYPCAGDEAQFCGGWNFKMVYRTSLYQ
jgi:hypothetical protein